MIIKFRNLWLLFVLTATLSSCASQKEIVYLQGIPKDYKQQIDESYELRIQPNDLIAIMVNSRDTELAQMFNLPMVSYNTGTKTTGQNQVLGYLVSKQGTIDFPLLGEVYVEGMTRTELKDFIKNQLIDRGLVNDPVVTVQYLNFQVSVMGEVNRPGTFDISSDRITIFDALSRAGDMSIYGMRDKVKLIREENNQRSIVTIDLRSDEVLSSPYYYLRQNDVIYVEPNKARAGQREINSNRTISTYASILSVILSTLSLIY